ncbi:MAG: sulfite exporter TauE/SafE family protein [Ilumatobacteraceae bacterium]
MTIDQLAVVAGAVFFASFVQAIAGFGSGLLSMPLMTLAISPTRAVVVSTLVSIMITTWQAWSMRRDADVELVRRLIVPAYLGMPLGVVVLSTVGDNPLRIMLGSAVLIAVVLLACNFQLGAGRRVDIIAGFLSGVLNTSLSTNGPPLVFVLQARRLPPAQFRATLSAVFALSNVLALALFIGTGKVNGPGLLGAAVAAPALALGQVLGFPMRRHVHGSRFRWMVLVLLVLAGSSAIAAALR